MPRYMANLCNASGSLRALFIALMLFTNFNEGSYSKDIETFQVGIIKEVCEQFNFTTLDQEDSLTWDNATRNMIIEEICIDHETFRDLDHTLKNSSFLCIVGDINTEKDQILSSLSPLYSKSYLSPYGASIYRKTSSILSMGSSSRQMSQALLAILQNLQWQNMLLIVQPSQYWIEFSMTMLISYTRDAFIPTLRYLEDAFIDSSSNFSNTEKILASATSEQKAIILCADVDATIRVLQVAAALNMASKYAFFHITTSPYVDDGASIATAEFPHPTDILRNIFIFKADFLSMNSSRNRQHTNTDSTTFIKDSLSVIYQAILSFNDTSSIDVVRLFKNMQNKTIQGHSGYIVTDHERNVLFDHYLYAYRDETKKFETIGRVTKIGPSWSFNLASEDWFNHTFPVADSCFKRICDTNNKDIDPMLIATISLSILILVGIIIGVVILLWRNFGKRELGKGPNKLILTPDDLVFLQRRNQSKGSSKIMNGQVLDKPDLLRASEKPNRSLGSLHEYSDITDLARYNGDLVHVKELKIKGLEMKNKIFAYIKMLKEIRHENVNAFIGLLNDPDRPAMVSDYCNRGSLEDVIKNKDIKLDWDFKLSLLTDLVRGLRYMHSCPIKWHGNLKSRNCLIDSRWVLKLADFGIGGFLAKAKLSVKCEAKDLLWTAPEHLRENVSMKGSEKGDVFSFSIIMQEVILRSQPYSMTGLSPQEIINKVKHPPPFLRPSVTHQAAPPEYVQIMKVCWSENPDIRPCIEEIYHQFKTITGGKKLNIVDTMFRMLEKYSTDLEDIVRERTLELEEEKKKTDTLLFRMLPTTVAENLKAGLPIAAESFSEVTIYFSDIVGFTTISAMSNPMQVVDLLNDLYTMFDATINNYDVYKVETIGDAYMVVSGLPIRNGNRHAGEVGTMALDLLSQCGTFTIRHMPEVPLRVRIGLHSGSCVAGVVGLTMPRYCLFGDTVNTASRMESSGTESYTLSVVAFRIHLSQETKNCLDLLGGYHTSYRGEVELKGKGLFKTYWLTGKDGFNKKLPEPPPLDGLGSVYKNFDPTKFASSRQSSVEVSDSPSSFPESPRERTECISTELTDSKGRKGKLKRTKSAHVLSVAPAGGSPASSRSENKFKKYLKTAIHNAMIAKEDRGSFDLSVSKLKLKSKLSTTSSNSHCTDDSVASSSQCQVQIEHESSNSPRKDSDETQFLQTEC